MGMIATRLANIRTRHLSRKDVTLTSTGTLNRMMTTKKSERLADDSDSLGPSAVMLRHAHTLAWFMGPNRRVYMYARLTDEDVYEPALGGALIRGMTPSTVYRTNCVPNAVNS